MMTQQRKKTYQEQNERVPIIGSMSNRDVSGNKDQRFVNMFPETRKVEAIESTRIFLNKRPGLTLYKDFGTGYGRGIAWFRDRLYVAVDGNIYEDSATPTSVITLTDADSKVGMLLANSSTIGDYLFICDGTGAWIVKSDGSILTVGADGVGSVTVDTGGTAYLTAPKVYFLGVGSGAAATATLSSGVLSSIAVTSSGSGYTTLPTVVFSTTITPDSTTDTFASTIPHQLTTSDRVKITATTTLPTGISGATAYYVVNPTENTFQISLTSGGSAVDFTTNGAGVISVSTGAPTTHGTATAAANNFPTPHIPIPAFIDGYVLLATGSDVYNCALDNPSVWNSGEYLSAEMFPDPVVALARQNNQVVVFGGSSTEFFYDAANVSGSPLTRNESTTLQMGCAMPYAVFQTEKTFMFVGQSESGGRAVWQVDGFQPKKISDEYIERILDGEATPEECYGFGVRTMGHLFYVLNLTSLGRTLVYDMDEKLWHEWSSNTAGAHTVFNCDFLCDAHIGAAYVLHNSNGCVYKVDPTKYMDDDVAILVDVTTNKYDMDTYKRKFMRNIRPVGDQYASGNALDVRWSDDDYQTWSNTKTITLTDGFPNWARLGCFRRRAFNLKHSSNYPLRMESLEISYYEGDS